MAIILTEAAASRLKEMKQDFADKPAYLRLAVRKQCRCGNVHFGMGWDHQVHSDDNQLDIEGIPMVIDAASAPLLQDAVVEYKEEAGQAGFLIQTSQTGRSHGGCCGKHHH